MDSRQHISSIVTRIAERNIVEHHLKSKKPLGYTQTDQDQDQQDKEE